MTQKLYTVTKNEVKTSLCDCDIDRVSRIDFSIFFTQLLLRYVLETVRQSMLKRFG